MGNLALTEQWHEEITQIEKGDLVIGGPNGMANKPTKQVAENVLFLKNNQSKLNDKFAIYYDNVAQLVAAQGLKDGLVVATKGYYALSDGGEARYLVSSTATDYSIPLANNLHAIFADSFDIRKFGIRNSATLDQTTEIQRMVKYADSRVYEIDFLNFDIKSPDLFQFYSTGKANYRCLGFNYLHHIKNLIIRHDKTKQLTPGRCLLGFYPKNNMIGTFKLTNVKFDAWVDNYTLTDPKSNSVTDEGDGAMHGFSTFPHPEWANYLDYAESFSDISFELDNVEFLSAAVSYNIELARIPAKKVTLKNVRGDFIALMVHEYCKNLISSDVHGVYRDDLHAAGRLLVTNLIHCEPALVTGKNISIDDILLENMSAVTYSTGAARTVYRYYAMGLSTLIKRVLATNVKGAVGTNVAVAPSYSMTIQHFEIKDSPNVSLGGNFSANKVRLSNVVMDSNIIPSTKTWADFEADNSTLNFLFFDSSNTDLPTQGDFKFINCKFTDSRGIGYSRASNRWFNSISSINCTYAGSIVETGFAKLTVVGGEVSTNAANTTDAITPTKVADGDVRLSEIYIEGIRSTKPQLASTFFVKGTFAPSRPINLLAVNNVLVSKLNWSGASVSAKNIGNVFANSVTSVVYDPQSLATATQQSTTVALTGAKLGDNLNVSFDKPLKGTRMWGEVTAADTVTVYHRNDTGVEVDLPSGTLTVKII